MRRRNSRSIRVFGSFRVRGYIWVKEIRQGSHEGPTRVEGAPRGGRRAPYLVASSSVALRPLQVLWIMFVMKITFPKVSFRLDSV